MSKKETGQMNMSGVRKLESNFALIPYDKFAAVVARLNQVERMEFLGGFVKWTDRLIIAKDEQSLASFEEQLAKLRDSSFTIPRGDKGQLLWDPNTGLPQVDPFESHGDLALSARNNFGTSNSGGTGSGGSTNPDGDGGSDNVSGGSGGALPDPEGDEVRVQVSGSQNVNLTNGAGSVTLNAIINNFSDDPTGTVEWQLTGSASGVDALVKSGNPVTFNFSETGQYIAQANVEVGGVIYSDSLRVSVLADEDSTISAGADRTIDGEATPTIALAGSVSNGLATVWEQIGGSPNGAIISAPNAPTSNVTFSQGGTYSFRLSVSGDVSVYDEVSITVTGLQFFSLACVPSSISTGDGGPEVEQIFVQAASSVSDASYVWECTKKPNSAQVPAISSPNQAYSDVTLYAAGFYTFRVTATRPNGESRTANCQVYHKAGDAIDHERVIFQGGGGEFRLSSFGGLTVVSQSGSVSSTPSSLNFGNFVDPAIVYDRNQSGEIGTLYVELRSGATAPSALEWQVSDEGVSWVTFSTAGWNGDGNYSR